LGAGDLLLLHTDGLSEHSDDQYFLTRVEERLRQVKVLTTQEIYEAIYAGLLQFAPPNDGITLMVVKRES